jgi:precorrin-2/cobalt-factor-2 C20-methyltransferase
MAGKLFVVGVGPGDPELLTLKGARILGEVGCIVVPKGKEEGESLALSIVKDAVSLDGKEIVETWFPMVRTMGASAGREPGAEWASTAEAIVDRIDRGIDTAFITIGDPSIYSTFFYVYERIMHARPGLQVEIVPGISSINASAAAAGLSLGLGDGRIAIMPANYLSHVDEVLDRFDTVVLMKVYRVLPEIKTALAARDLLDKAVCVCRAGMADERICADLSSLEREDIDYFSLIIVRRERVKR